MRYLEFWVIVVILTLLITGDKLRRGRFIEDVDSVGDRGVDQRELQFPAHDCAMSK